MGQNIVTLRPPRARLLSPITRAYPQHSRNKTRDDAIIADYMQNPTRGRITVLHDKYNLSMTRMHTIIFGRKKRTI